MQDLVRQWGGLAAGMCVLAVIAVRLCFSGRSEGSGGDGASWFGSGDGGHNHDDGGGGHH